jgi:hypothetical protein
MEETLNVQIKTQLIVNPTTLLRIINLAYLRISCACPSPEKSYRLRCVVVCDLETP